jgi:uncharacterized protein (TIGR02453 family)
MTTARFTGFPADTFGFLGALAKHNDREWFAAHRDRYDESCVAPALAFVEAVGPRVKALLPGTKFDAQLGGSLLRIHRDLRFVRDSRPYKDYLDLWFWRGEDKGRDAPSFGVRVHSDRIVVGAGIRSFGAEQLAAYRAAVDDNRRGKALASMLAPLLERGRYTIVGKALVRVPTGFDADHPRADLLRRVGLFVCREIAVGKSAGTAKFADECVGHFEALVPVCKWLAATL